MRREETLFTPELAADGGEGVGKGGVLLAIPGSGCDGQAHIGAEARTQERDEGEQREQAGRRACDGQLRPLPLGLDTEMVTHFPEGDFQLPALNEPGDDLERVAGGSVQSRACGSKRCSGSRSSTQRMGTTGSPA